MGTVTAAQELYLGLIEKTSFNELDGEKVAKDLKRNTHLWRAAIVTRLLKPVFQKLENPITRSGPSVPLVNRVDLIVLRDLPKDRVNLDTVVLMSEPACQAELTDLATSWSPTEMSWYGARESFRAMGEALVKVKDFSREDDVLLFLWWS